MALDPDLLALMPHTVSIRHRTSKTLYGDAAYSGTSTSFRCRIEPNTQRVAASQTVESWPAYRLYVDSGGVITVDDELTMPNGDKPDIKSVADHYDETGALVYQEVTA